MPLSRDAALEKLNRQIVRAEELRAARRFSTEFKKWQRDTEVAIEHIFGADTRHTEDFTSIRYSLMAWTNLTPDYQFQKVYVSGLESAVAVLESFVDEIHEYGESDTDGQRPHPISRLELLFDRFHFVARQLRERHDGRSTLEVEDEYDVQDLMHALLRLDFDDIRREEWTPSYAGGASRIDFLLKDHDIVIEVKKTRKGLGAREVGDQLLLDIGRYGEHPNVGRLECFVYDPEGRIGNPRGLEADLSGAHGGIDVHVVVAPRAR